MKKLKDTLLENDFGAYLYNLRCQEEYTIEELVQKIDMQTVTIKKVKKWEHDMEFPDLNEMYKISEIYEIPIERLMQVRTQTLEQGLKGIHKTIIRILGYILGISIYATVMLSYIFLFVAGIWAMLLWAEIPNKILRSIGVR